MDRERIAFFQRDFYRDQYRLALKFFLLLCGLSLVLVCVIGWQLMFNKAPQRYFAALTNGQVLPLNPG